MAWHTEKYTRREFEHPANTRERAAVAWHLLRDWERAHGAASFGINVFSTRDAASSQREATSQIVDFLISYLEEAIEDQSDVLALLVRYATRAEWFDSAKLRTAYESDTARGEAILDQDLRRYLFTNGIDYPFSAPDSPSGRADVIAQLDTKDPLVLEVKLYGGKANYNVEYLAKGFKQELKYAMDYNKTDAYLFVFSLSDDTFEFENDRIVQGVPVIDVGTISIAIVTARLGQISAASTPGKTTIRRISKDDLRNDSE